MESSLIIFLLKQMVKLMLGIYIKGISLTILGVNNIVKRDTMAGNRLGHSRFNRE